MKNEFIVVQREVMKDIGLKERKIILCLNFKHIDICYPHPVNSFFKSKYFAKNLANNTIRAYAEDLKGFLNYLINSYEQVGIKNIKLEYVTDYLNFLNEKISEGDLRESTFKRKAMILERFIRWLKDEGEFEGIIHDNNFIKVYVNNFCLYVKKNVFEHPDYNVILAKENDTDTLFGSEVIHDFPDNRVEYMKTFLEIALSTVPEIAFGIALQFFGGLRRGEVINLSRDAFSSEIDSESPYFFVNVADRFEEIFPGKINSVNEEVKVVRKQLVLNLGIVNELYKIHKTRIDTINPKSKAMFISKNGKAICGQSYARKFNYIKEIFLDYIFIKDRNAYEYLSKHEWGSHFGRGVFTNFLIDDLKWTPHDVMLMRYDKNIGTTQLYVDRITLLRKAKKVLDIVPQLMKSSEISKIKDVAKLLKK